MNYRIYQAGFVAYTLLIAGLSLSPATGTSQLWDKPLHLAAYTIFLLLGSPLCRKAEHLYWMAAGIFAYSGFIEVAQHFVPGRYMSAGDMAANAMGVILGLLLARSLERRGKLS
jgi:VanZ family protein